MKKCFNLLIKIVIFGGILTFPFPLFGLELSYPPLPGVSPPQPGISLEEFLRYLYHLFLFIGVIIAFLVLIYGGFLYLISLTNPFRLREAREKIISAFLGLLILFSSHLILQAIDPSLTIFQLPQKFLVFSPPPSPKIDIPERMPNYCAKITNFKKETQDLIDYLLKKDAQLALLDGALITGSDSLYNKFRDINKISQFTCEEARVYCCPVCLTPEPVVCTWGEGAPLAPWLQDAIKAAEEALSEFAEKNIKQLIESEEAKRTKGILNQLKSCNLDYATVLFINSQAEKKGILDELKLGPGEPLDFYCCSY